MVIRFCIQNRCLLFLGIIVLNACAPHHSYIETLNNKTKQNTTETKHPIKPKEESVIVTKKTSVAKATPKTKLIATHKIKPTPAEVEKPIVKTIAFLVPVKGKIIKKFGFSDGQKNQGIDITAPIGSPIYAAQDGTIIYSDNKISAYGNMIMLRHKEGYVTIYAYNQKNLKKENESVKKGEVIATLGQTGATTLPAVHFEIRKEKVPMDPLPLLSLK